MMKKKNKKININKYSNFKNSRTNFNNKMILYFRDNNNNCTKSNNI